MPLLICSKCRTQFKKRFAVVMPICGPCKQTKADLEEIEKQLQFVISGTITKEEFIKNTGFSRKFLNKKLLEKNISRFTHTYFPKLGFKSLSDTEFWNSIWNVYSSSSNANVEKNYGIPIHRLKHIFRNMGYKLSNEERSKKTSYTCLEKYGESNPMQSDTVKLKRKATNLRLYGVDNYFKQPGISEKIKQKVRSKYGVDHPSNLVETRERISKKFTVKNKTKAEERLKKTGYELLGSYSGITPKLNGKYSGHQQYTVKHLKCGNCFKSAIMKNPRCPVCYPKSISSFQQEYMDFVNSLEVKNSINKKFKTQNKIFEIDIFFDELNIGLEFNSLIFHSINPIKADHQRLPSYHLNKSKKALDCGIRVVHIWEHQDRSLIKDRIKNLLGLNKKIYARSLVLKKLTYAQAREFYEQNHMHGATTNIGESIGLFDNNVLYSAISYRKMLDGIEISRFASARGITVLGAFSKLLKRFPKNKPVYSYIDTDWTPDFSKSVYATNGFKLIRHTGPSLYYTNFKEVWSRQKFQKHKLKRIFPDVYDSRLTANEILEKVKIYPFYTCGSWFCCKPI